MNTELHNFDQIEQLNQRGGRTLSIVDLIRAGTINAEMAACAFRAMENGASILTGARPGGAGKTTLMAALLGFLPPEVPIATVDRPAVIQEGHLQPTDRAECYLVHEIGSGHWFGYLWGPDVADFLSLIEGRRRIASCLHADTLEELRQILSSPPLGVEPSVLARVGLVLFMHVDAAAGYRRRVSTFYQADGAGNHRLLYRWDPNSDSFQQTADVEDPAGLKRYIDFIRRIVDKGQVDTRAVRREIVEFYRAGK